MRFFFALMVIYMPIYLNAHIGFSWSEIGVIFTIMLLPFVLFELPIGRLADAKLNEKGIMIIGFVITAVFTAVLAFISSSSIALWAAILFGTRVGMSLVEITSESYFFKHIDSTDTPILSVFRNTRSIAYLAGPLIASLLLVIADMRFLFLALAIIMLYGVWNSIMMRKTKNP